MDIDDKLEQVLTALEGTGIPVTYENWPESEVPEMPYLVYRATEGNPFYADGAVYFISQSIEVELYTSLRSPEAERFVEKSLRDFTWNKKMNYLKNEHCFMCTYDWEV